MAMAMAMVVVVVLLLPSALLLLAGLPISRAELIERHSFTSPFSSHDHKGSRVIPHWETGGSAQVKQSFLRLTQDKPNQKGYVFSRGALGAQELSLAIKFRLSGMGADNFGDGLAVVIADKGKFESGNLLGFTDHFKGISVIFDTNRKDKNIDSIHRDVVLLASDGSKPMSQGGMTLTGCSANLRYSESRDDFNVLKSSRMRLKVTPQNVVTVEIDGRNTGRWRRCASIDLNEAGLETGWLESMRIGLTASTSSGSSDNHDVLHLRVYSAAEEATLLETEDLGSETDDDFLILVHHMEHELYDVHASLQTMVEELQQQEKESEERILELEEQLSKQVLDRLDQRLKSLEVRVKGNVDNALGSRLESMEETMTSRLASTLSQEAAGKYTGWRLPFVLLLIVIGSIFYLLYRQYLHLKKMHFL